ncbi:hypothetical protein KW805_03805 [Candidatus Pacearchaeota archaeon]|nr:hypothetical protein [Candidatus Pacearchaeota archaeon]
MLALLILILSIPIGYLIAWMARDELIMGRPWFKALIIISIILAGVFLFIGMKAQAFTSVFIAIVSAISLKMSFNKKWTKRNI